MVEDNVWKRDLEKSLRGEVGAKLGTGNLLVMDYVIQ